MNNENNLEELIRTIDSFLVFMKMDVSNITMKKRRKLLKKTINNLQMDNYYVEYCLSECTSEDKRIELMNRINASNMVIGEIKQDLQLLPRKEKSLFLKNIKK